MLNNHTLEQLPKLLSISKHTLLTIKTEPFWAFSYNIVAIPMAITGQIEPMAAAFFMAFSDIVVIVTPSDCAIRKFFSTLATYLLNY